ncbi:hypothetical protein KI387_001325, partial [Taxus chinensis]
MDVLMELTLNHLNICAHEGCLPQLLIDDPKQRLLIEAFPLKEILEHKLNPLKFITANNMLETNQSKAFGGVERIDMFVRPNFTFWYMVSTSVEEDEFEDHMIDEI